jgi:hypothetical protein
LAVERNAPFLVDEFRTLNRCLDNAIADAVAEFTYQHESLIGDKYTKDANERMGYFVHELRNLLGTATLAFRAAKTGSLGLQGATGSILERSLTGLTRLIDISLVDIRSISNQINPLHAFSLADFIGEVQAAAQLAARGRSCALVVPQVDPTLAISGNRV